MSTDGSGQGGCESPVRTGQGVRLVPPTTEHVPMLVQLGRDPAYRRWGEGTDTDTDAAARAWAVVAGRRWRVPSDSSPRQWVVEVRDAATEGATWTAAGLMECRRDGHGGGEVGYAVHPAFRARGLATAALRLALDHSFELDGLELVRWRAEVGNWASRRTAWRVGFPAPQTVRGLLPGRDGAQGPRDGWISALAPQDPRRPAHPWLEATELTDGEIRLRPWRDDARDAAALARTDEVARTYVGPVLPSQDPEQIAAWVTERRHGMAIGRSVSWCIADARDDAPLGFISVFDLLDPFAHGCAEVGYWLLPWGRGRGAVTAALRLATDHAFTALGLHRVSAATDARNTASGRALLRAGFRRVGTEAQSCVYEAGGPRHDTVLFELLSAAEVRGGG